MQDSLTNNRGSWQLKSDFDAKSSSLGGRLSSVNPFSSSSHCIYGPLWWLVAFLSTIPASHFPFMILLAANSAPLSAIMWVLPSGGRRLWASKTSSYWRVLAGNLMMVHSIPWPLFGPLSHALFLAKLQAPNWFCKGPLWRLKARCILCQSIKLELLTGGCAC